jgi:hypothetical protein
MLHQSPHGCTVWCSDQTCSSAALSRASTATIDRPSAAAEAFAEPTALTA